MIFDRLLSRAMRPDPSRQGGSMIFGLPSAGIRVDEDAALNYSAVWAAVSMIAHTLGIVSWQVHQRQDGRRERLFDHALARLLNVAPNDEMTPQTFKQTLAMNALLWGFGFAEIERNGRGDPVALWPYPSRNIEAFRKDSGALWYKVKPDEGGEVEIPARDAFVPIGLSFDGVTGISPIRRARESISMGIAMERYGASFFGNDARPSFVLEAPERLNEKAEQNLKDWLLRNHGGPHKKWTPAVFEQGVTLKTIGMPNDDAQFLESRRFQVGEIARWFNIPPHKIGDMERATFNNIDSRERMYVTEAVLPWARGFEEEGNRKLIAPNSRGRIFTKFNLNTLMRGDVQTRGDFYTKLFGVGAFSPNDIRILEDMNPIPGGDKHMIPGNMTTVQQAGAQMAPQQAMFDVFEDIASRMLKREYKAVTGASGREDFSQWLVGWYSWHHDQLQEAFRPAVEALSKHMGRPYPSAEVFRWSRDHCEAAVNRIGYADDIERAAQEWTSRSHDAASELIEAVTEAPKEIEDAGAA